MPHVAIPSPADDKAHRDSIGGYPFLPRDVPWPVCPKSGQPMTMFFQFDVRPEFGVSLAAGSHVIAFMSPVTNEIPTFDFPKSGRPLPDEAWRKRLDHFAVFAFPPGADLVAQPSADPYLVHHALDFVAQDDPEDPFLFVGGKPRWYQDPEVFPGFDFVCQLSENYPFAKLPSAAAQPSSFSKKAYCLFLGNSVYLSARAVPLHHGEVWVSVQN